MSPGLPRWLRRLILSGLVAAATSCSLGNVPQDDCSSAAQCERAFGLGSTCVSGFCSTPSTCRTGHDCRAKFGGGACVDGTCTANLPSDPACSLREPSDLFDQPAVGEGSYAILGGAFSLHEDIDQALAASARLAVREINGQGAGIDGRKIGIVFCDVSGEPAATGDARIALNEHAMDYLGGALGVPVMVGPLRSADSLALINRALQKRYPTALISPGATSPALTTQPDRLDASEPYGLFWRTCPSDTLQGKVLAEDVVAMDASVAKVAVAYVQDAYGNGLSQVFATTYGSDRTTLVPFASGGDMTQVANLVEASGADGVVIITVLGKDTVNLLKALSATKAASAKYFFTDGSKDKANLLDPTLPDAVKAMIQGAVGTAPAKPSGPLYQVFEADLLKDFGISADSYAFTAQAYDAGYCAGYALLYAQSKTPSFDGRTIAEGLAHLSSGPSVDVGPNGWTAAKKGLTSGQRSINVNGVSGNLDFEAATGEAPAPIEVWKPTPDLSDFVTVSVYTP